MEINKGSPFKYKVRIFFRFRDFWAFVSIHLYSVNPSQQIV